MSSAAPASAHPVAGVLLVVAAVSCFSAMDTVIRHLGAAVPLLVLLAARYGVQALMMTGWIPLHREAAFATAHPRFQVARGLLLLGSSGLGFMGLRYLPVAEFTSIGLLTPVIVTLLAATLLRERVSALRWALVAGAFAGALIVVRPGSGAIGWAALFPLGSAVCYASFQVLTARLAGLENPYTTHFWTGFVGTAVVVPLALVTLGDALLALPAQVTALQWASLVVIGLLGSSGHLMLIHAFGLARASTLMPFMYTQIGSAALAGWLAFGHVPDAWAWAGMAVIAACGAASAWLNIQRTAPPATVDAAVE